MIKLELVTLQGVRVNETVHEVTIPTPEGEIGVFEHHADLITLARPGVLSVRRQAGDRDEVVEHFAINGGVVEIRNNHVRVLVDEADLPEEVSEERAQAALARAQELANTAQDKVSLGEAELLIAQEQARLRLAELKRRHPKTKRSV